MSCNCYLRKYFQDTNKLFDTKEYSRVNKRLFRPKISFYSPFWYLKRNIAPIQMLILYTSKTHFKLSTSAWIYFKQKLFISSHEVDIFSLHIIIYAQQLSFFVTFLPCCNESRIFHERAIIKLTQLRFHVIIWCKRLSINSWLLDGPISTS